MTKQEAAAIADVIRAHVEELKAIPTRLTNPEIEGILRAIGAAPHPDNITIIDRTLRERGVDEKQIAEVLAMVRQKRIHEIHGYGKS